MRLVIAEKPSVAQSIAAVLGAKSRHDGYLEGGDALRHGGFFGNHKAHGAASILFTSR